MEYKQEILIHQLPLVDHFVKHLTYYRTIRSNIDHYEPSSPFWSDTCDAHLLQATSYWCMVFGSHDSNETHWKKLVATDSEAAIKSFREGLYKELGVSEKEWNAYWKEMVAFRNKYAAHRELKFQGVVPRFDLAFAAALYYEDWVREVIYPHELTDPPLRQQVAELEAKVSSEIVAALNATARKG